MWTGHDRDFDLCERVSTSKSMLFHLLFIWMYIRFKLISILMVPVSVLVVSV